jgi:YD repeat-containing protein
LSIVSEKTAPGGSAPNFSCPTSGTGVWCREYGYDRYGNRAVIDSYNGGLSAATPTTTGAYSSSTNRLTSTWADYDAAGNLTHFKFPGNAAFDWTAAYNGESKQRYFCAGETNPCTSSNDDAEYVYDGEGNRVQKVTAGETVTYVYDAFGRFRRRDWHGFSRAAFGAKGLSWGDTKIRASHLAGSAFRRRG